MAQCFFPIHWVFYARHTSFFSCLSHVDLDSLCTLSHIDSFTYTQWCCLTFLAIYLCSTPLWASATRLSSTHRLQQADGINGSQWGDTFYLTSTILQVAKFSDECFWTTHTSHPCVHDSFCLVQCPQPDPPCLTWEAHCYLLLESPA